MNLDTFLAEIDQSRVVELTKVHDGKRATRVNNAIALEGIDGAGKTTTAAAIAENSSVTTVVLHAIVCKDLPQWYADWHLFLQLMHKPRTFNVILDRTWLSEYAYARFFKRAIVPVGHVRRLQAVANGCFQAFRVLSNRKIVEICHSRLNEEDQELFTIEDLHRIQERYDYLVIELGRENWKYVNT